MTGRLIRLQNINWNKYIYMQNMLCEDIVDHTGSGNEKVTECSHESSWSCQKSFSHHPFLLYLLPYLPPFSTVFLSLSLSLSLTHTLSHTHMKTWGKARAELLHPFQLQRLNIWFRHTQCCVGAEAAAQDSMSNYITK